ncbi:unnamed protein product [Brugia timori]|uniref:Uncharacterized protein n=1 Tax=Brugia timori TaxID=42155 RepID=A0A0R3QPH4_9BILA|nr:unnamed protein product [Brugia timori]
MQKPRLTKALSPHKNQCSSIAYSDSDVASSVLNSREDAMDITTTSPKFIDSTDQWDCDPTESWSCYGLGVGYEFR